MCGIAGVMNYREEAPPVSESVLRRMAAHMAARGPDGEGIWLSSDRSVGLAHRRLAIIDLSEAGAQPMTDPETGNVIVFNGEIYNYRELRTELEKDGYRFRSHSDTEVLLHLYAHLGAAMVDRLVGMFAFALWDPRRRSLFLARDPFGIKPLYFADDGQTIRFASQVKTLLASGVNAAPDPAGIAGFFLWGHVPEPRTWVAAIRALPAGCTLTVTPGRVAAPRRFFDLREAICAAEQAGPPSANVVAEAVTAVNQSVARHLVADVPVGTFLFAGRDSALIAALAARHHRDALRTITLGFDEFRDTHQDEVPIAEAVAAAIGAHHQTRRVTREDFEAIEDQLFAAMDQPSIDGVNAYCVSKVAHEAGLKVVLSGLGGDELFGGYPSFLQVPRLARRMRLFSYWPSIGRAFRLASVPIIRRWTNPKWASVAEYGGTLHGAWLLRRALFLPWEVASLLPPEFAEEGLAALDVENELRARIAGIRNPKLAVMALEMSGYMRNQLLRDADWAGMAHALEIRVPFVDIELLRRWLPLAVGHFPLDRQQLLEAANPNVARLVGARPKSGFSVPVAQWLDSKRSRTRTEPGLRPWARKVGCHFVPSLAQWRIGALLTDAYGGIGGIAKFNRDLLGAISVMPEVTAVVAFPRLMQRPPESIPDKVWFETAAAKGKTAYALTVFRALLSKPRWTLVVCGHINLLPLAWVAARMQRAPLLLIVHGIEAWHAHRSRLVRSLLPRVDRIAAVSRYTVARIQTWTQLPEERFRVLPNCVDLEMFAPQPRNEALAERYGLSGRRVLLTVGRLAGRERYKGFDQVIEILPRLAQEIPEIVYVIVGDGDDRERLKRKAEDLGVADRVRFTGFVSETEKIDLYNLADVYVMPSEGEGFGIVYLEAMACGVPVIGSVRDGSRDALRDGKLGLLVDPREPDQIIAAIRKALEMPRGRPTGLDFFSHKAYAERAATLVREMVVTETC